MYVCMYVYIYMCIYMYIYMCVCACVYLSVGVYVVIRYSMRFPYVQIAGGGCMAWQSSTNEDTAYP